MKVRVAIVEDDKNYNQALQKIIDFQKDVECVAQFYNGNTVLQELENLEPEVVLMGINYKVLQGLT